MILARSLIWITAAIFLLFGLIYMIQPALFLSPVAITAGPQGMADIRATYGGVQIGIAAFLLWTVWGGRLGRVRAGLWALFLIIVGISLCRVIGLMIAGEVSQFHLVAFGFEIPIILLSYILLARLPRE